MKHSSVIVWWPIVALLFAACPKKEEVWDPSEHPPIAITGDASTTDADEPRPATGGAAFRLLDPGEQPREQLRYDIPEGFAGSLDMELAMSVRRPQPFDMPRIRLRMNLSQLERDEEGFAYAFQLDEPEIVEETIGDMPADRAESLRRDLTRAARLEGKAQLDHRGVLRDVSFEGGREDGGFDQLSAEIEHSVRSMTMPLPEEPVGIGAKWEVSQTLTLNGLSFEQRTEMVLRERDGKRLVIDTKISQIAGRQRVENPQLPPDAEMFVDRMRGSSVGVAYVDLNSLVPHRSTVTRSTNESLMEVVHAGQLHHFEVGMDMELSLSPNPASAE